jgi:hypothetical protein
MFKVSVPLKRAASRRNSIKSKADFTLEGLCSLSLSSSPLPFPSRVHSILVQKVIFPDYFPMDLESEYGVWIERGDKVYRTSFRRVNVTDSGGVSLIEFHEILSLPVTLFQDHSGKYLVSCCDEIVTFPLLSLHLIRTTHRIKLLKFSYKEKRIH